MLRWAPVLLVALVGCSPDANSLGETSATSTLGATTAIMDSGSSAAGSTGTTGADTTAGPGTTGTTSSEDESTTGPPLPTGLLAHFGTFIATSDQEVQMVGGVGFEPRAVLLWTTNHTEEGVIDLGYFGRGWTDGTNSGAVATAWERGGDTVRARWNDTACITLMDEDAEILAEGSGAGMHDDGFSIDWTTPGDGRMVAFLALGGEIEARVGNRVLSTASETFDRVGFSPDIVFLAGVQGQVSPGTNNRGGHGFGGAIANGPAHSSAHREGTTGTGSSGLADGVALITVDEIPAVDHSYVLSGVDFNGFGLARQAGMGAVGSTWLAIRGVQASGGVIAQPAAGGDQAVSTDFEPVVVLFDGGDKAMQYESEPEIVHGVAVGTQSGGALWMGRAGGATQTAWDFQQALVSRTADAALAAQAAVSATDASGFTLNWTAVDAGPRRIGWFALGSAPR